MPEARSKSQIIKRLETERRRLERTIALLSPKSMLQAGVVGNSSAKDVLAHLADWEARMPVWMEAARSGDPVESPAPGLTWKQLDILNQRIYDAHHKESLEQVLECFRATHQRFMEMVAAMSEEEMLAPGRYSFTGKAAVYDWLKGFANHDLWGKTKIREWMKVKAEKKSSHSPRRPSRSKLIGGSTGSRLGRRAQIRRVRSS